MIEVGLQFASEGVLQRLQAFGIRAPALLDEAVKSTGGQFQKSVRANELAGALLGVNTGKTARKYPTMKKSRRRAHCYYSWGGPLANIFEHAGGANIFAKKKPVLKWKNGAGEWRSAKSVHLRSRPFMSHAATRFDWDTIFNAAAEKVMVDEIQRRGLK